MQKVLRDLDALERQHERKRRVEPMLKNEEMPTRLKEAMAATRSEIKAAFETKHDPGPVKLAKTR